MKKIRIFILILSLITGFAGTFAFVKFQPGMETAQADGFPMEQPEVLHQQVWWGSLYPEYCLGAMKLVTEDDVNPDEKHAGDDIPVRIRFKYLTFLNHLGGNHE